MCVSAEEGLYLLIKKLHRAPLKSSVKSKQCEHVLRCAGLDYSIKIDTLHLHSVDPQRAPWTWFLLPGPGPPPCGPGSSLIRPISAVSSSDLIMRTMYWHVQSQVKREEQERTQQHTALLDSVFRRFCWLESPTLGCRGRAGAQVTEEEEEDVSDVGVLTTLFLIILL